MISFFKFSTEFNWGKFASILLTTKQPTPDNLVSEKNILPLFFKHTVKADRTFVSIFLYKSSGSNAIFFSKLWNSSCFNEKKSYLYIPNENEWNCIVLSFYNEENVPFRFQTI